MQPVERRNSREILERHLGFNADYSIVISSVKDEVKFDVSNIPLKELVFLKECLNFHMKRIFVDSIEPIHE